MASLPSGTHLVLQSDFYLIWQISLYNHMLSHCVSISLSALHPTDHSFECSDFL